jgi:hypothetical protein
MFLQYSLYSLLVSIVGGGGDFSVDCCWSNVWVDGIGGIPRDKIDVAGGPTGNSTIGDESVKFVDVRFIYFSIIVNVALCALWTVVSEKTTKIIPSFIYSQKKNPIIPSICISFGIDCPSTYSFTFLYKSKVILS